MMEKTRDGAIRRAGGIPKIIGKIARGVAFALLTGETFLFIWFAPRAIERLIPRKYDIVSSFDSELSPDDRWSVEALDGAISQMREEIVRLRREQQAAHEK